MKWVYVIIKRRSADVVMVMDAPDDQEDRRKDYAFYDSCLSKQFRIVIRPINNDIWRYYDKEAIFFDIPVDTPAEEG